MNADNHILLSSVITNILRQIDKQTNIWILLRDT